MQHTAAWLPWDCRTYKRVMAQRMTDPARCGPLNCHLKSKRSGLGYCFLNRVLAQTARGILLPVGLRDEVLALQSGSRKAKFTSF